MPVIQICLNVDLNKEEKKLLLESLTSLIASTMDKPKKNVMVLHSFREIIMGGEFDPAAFIDFRCLSGLNPSNTKSLCEGISMLLKSIAFIDASRINVNFFEVNDEHAWSFVDGVAICPKYMV